MANYEQLFLLEVLVDRVKLLTKALAPFAPQDEDEPDTPIRIRVKFSDFPCFEITQDLAPPEKDKKDSDVVSKAIMFNSGKSCMFPMDPEQLIQDLIKYPMAVTVFKKNPNCSLPDIIGQTKVPLGDFMTNTIKKAAGWSLEEPISELISDTFPLRNAQDQDVGTINMLIRLTCFGKTIITKFQIADNNKSFLFKNSKTQDYEFQCKKCMPGQPIQRQQPRTSEDAAWENEGMIGDNEPYVLDKEQMTDYYPEKIMGNRESPMQGPGYQKHEMHGPGVTASMEMRYPEDHNHHDHHNHDHHNHDHPDHHHDHDHDDDFDGPCVHSGPMETQSAPQVKNGKKNGKEKARGKNLDSKKMEIENGVPLEQPKRKRRSKFYVQPGISYPGVILGHRYCVNQGPPVPAKNGWAWRTTCPLGMKWEEMRGWKPGSYLKQCWATMKEQEEIRKMGKRKRIKRKPILPDTRKTTVHIHRQKGIYHVTMNPIPGPDDKEEPEPVVYTLERPEDGSEASEIELDLTIPDLPYPPPPTMKHQAQQFCEEDLPLILPKPVVIKKKKIKKERSADKKPTAKKGKAPPGKAASSKSKASGISKKGKEAAQPEKGGKGGKGAPAPAKGGKGAPPAKGGKGAPAPSVKGGKGAPPAKGGKGALPDKGGKDAKGKPVTPAKGGKSAPPAPAKGGKAAPSEKGGKPSASKESSAPPSRGKGSGKKSRRRGSDDEDVYPWDDWIMKLKCKKRHSPEDEN